VTISNILISILAATAATTAPLDIPDEDLRGAGQAYVHCLIYHGIRSDSKQVSADVLVSVAKQDCRVHKGVWVVLFEMSLESRKQPMSKENMEATVDVLERRFERAAIDVIEPILIDVHPSSSSKAN
jgi:hypothetical protein